jgi:hypothetical protein
MGWAIASSTICCAARRTLGSSPSGRTTRRGSCWARHDPAHDPAGASEAPLEFVAILVEIDHLARDATRDGGPGDGGGHAEQGPRIEGEGDQIVRPELHLTQPIERGETLWYILFGERGECPRRRHLHLLVDLGRAGIQCAAEDEGETEDVVDLIGIVGAAGGDDGIVAHGAHLVREDLRHGVGQREDDRGLGHAGDHLPGDRSRHGESNEDIGAVERLGDGAGPRRGSEARLVGIHVLHAAGVDHSLPVTHHNMLALDAESHVVLGGGDRRGAGAGEDDADLLDRLADDLERVEERGAGDDRRPMLIVVEDGDLHRLPEGLLDDEAVGGPDVLQVDPADGGFEELAEADHILWVLGPDLEIEDIEIGELLEEIPLAFHHRLAGQGADVAETEHRGPVGHVGVGVIRVRLDLEAGLGDPRGVGQCEVALIGQRFGGDDRDLPGAALRVVVECVLAFHR